MTPCSGYTALSCVAPGCGFGDDATVGAEVVAALREVVRAGEQGVLVSSGCFLGAGVCAARPTAPVVVVQPCDDARRPTSCALVIGPLRTGADVASLGGWLRAGDLDPRLLPAHLLARTATRRG
jgi:hypothetical protein